MNNYFYTFYQGDLWRHNSNAIRNSFYGLVSDSSVTTVFNTSPLENKLYKTVALQGAEAWAALMQTDIQISDTIEAAWFEIKEQVWFAQNPKRIGRVPVRLRDNANPESLGLQQTTDQGHAEAGVINIGITRNNNNVAAIPAQLLHLPP